MFPINYHFIFGLTITTIILIYLYLYSINYKDFYQKILDLLELLPLPKYIKHIIFYLQTIHNPNLIHNSQPSYSKRKLTPLKKKIVASNQSWKCQICQKKLDYTYEVDHIIPLYRGGSNQISNLQALCRNCHGQKTLTQLIN